MATILVPPSQLPPRTVRTLRRSISHPLHTVSVEQWYPEATHVVIETPIPCLALVCAIASAGRVALVKPAFLHALAEQSQQPIRSLTEAHHYNVSDVVLQPDTNLLWVGRISLAAYNFWKQLRSKQLPLWQNKVLLIGELRPRGGAASAAPSTAVLRHVLAAAGATVVSDDTACASFAIVAPGVSPSTCTLVQHLVDNKVLCLGPAFVIDLLLRLDADPMHYVLFDHQRALCSPRFSASTMRTMTHPLRVSNVAQEHLSQQRSEVANHTGALLCPPKTENPRTRARSPTGRPKDAQAQEKDAGKAPENSGDALPTEREKSASPPETLRVKTKRASAPGGVSAAPNVRKSARLEAKKRTSGSTRPTGAEPASVPDGSQKCAPSASVSVTARKKSRSKRSRPCPKKTQKAATISNAQQSEAKSGPPKTENPTEEACTAEKNPSACGKGIEQLGCVVSPITPLQGGRSRKRCRNEGETCRSSSSEEEVKIVRRAKRARTSECTSSMRGENGAPTRQGEQFTAGARDRAVQSLNFEQLQDSDGTVKEFTGKGEGPACSSLSRTGQDDTGHDAVADCLNTAQSGGAAEEREERRSRAKQGLSHRSRESSERIRAKWDVDSDDEVETAVRSGGVGDSTCDVRDDNHHGALQSIEEGFEMFLRRMGGEPKEKDILQLIKALGGAEDLDETDGEREEADGHENQVAVFSERDLEEQSPVLVDDEDGFGGAAGDGGDDKYGRVDGMDKDLLSQYVQGYGTGSGGVLRRRKKEEFDPLQIRVPSERIVLEGVIAAELVLPERAGWIPKRGGHCEDDRLCESEVDVSEWIFGAEKYVGGHGLKGEMGGSGAGGSWSFRQMWVALFESGVIGRLAGGGGGLSESETRLVSGVCMRLVACDGGTEVLWVLVKELLELRERELQSGYDSLGVVLGGAGGGAGVRFRHKAIAGIWCAVMRRARRCGGDAAAWSVINRGLQWWFAEELKKKKKKKKKKKRGKGDDERVLVSLVSGMVAIGSMFGVRFVSRGGGGHGAAADEAGERAHVRAGAVGRDGGGGGGDVQGDP
ncbi:unnamed protein product [Agarophyton chilense]